MTPCWRTPASSDLVATYLHCWRIPVTWWDTSGDDLPALLEDTSLE